MLWTPNVFRGFCSFFFLLVFCKTHRGKETTLGHIECLICKCNSSNFVGTKNYCSLSYGCNSTSIWKSVCKWDCRCARRSYRVVTWYGGWFNDFIYVTPKKHQQVINSFTASYFHSREPHTTNVLELFSFRSQHSYYSNYQDMYNISGQASPDHSPATSVERLGPMIPPDPVSEQMWSTCKFKLQIHDKTHLSSCIKSEWNL